MRVEVVRSGGFAGLTRTWQADISSAEAQDRWLPLMESGLPPAPGPARDTFEYSIRIDDHCVTVAESEVQGPWRELVDRVRKASGRPADGSPADGSPADG